ncbi:hypothetical protein O1611_g3400 [Lasiodiplodia mahajangana]|uniref:Uncharacterized protein n=1 Tax=Lasiodiplodia mahajangana TaxID=1108764 RepID=A0ACC2JSI3_9PEZI|nr:hypothetical protein O1611_g3400 [Lasiodiplodia mahajangana]
MPTPIFLSPALPSELLSYILDHHIYPSTLIICSSQAEFLDSLVEDVRKQLHKNTRNIDQEEPHGCEPSHSQHPEEEEKHALLSSPLYQVATSRHIRVIYVPTVTHLRAYLSVFSPAESRVPVPPNYTLTGDNKTPHIILYGFLGLHRDTSEWSAQGLSNTISTLVEVVHRLSWGGILIEPRIDSCDPALEELLQETVPILNGGARNLGSGFENGAWTGRTVEVGRILGRWCRFQRAQWDVSK